MRIHKERSFPKARPPAVPHIDLAGSLSAVRFRPGKARVSLARTVADQFAETPVAAGIKRIFGVVLTGGFLCLVQLGLPVKVVVFNNGALGFIEIGQKSPGFLDFGTGFKNPNFAAITSEMAKGFTFYTVKAIFSGRGDDLVDLARSNLWA
jgi:hypothetical protein